MFPSFVTCMVLLASTCVPFGADCLKSLRINRPWFLLCSACYLGSLFFHFTEPDSQLYWVTVCLFSAMYVGIRAKSRPWPVLQALLIGVTVQVAAERISVLYPYTAWHRVPVFFLFALLWCAVAWLFADDRSQCVTFIAAIYVVGMIREWCVSDINTMDHVGSVMCNQYWVAVIILVMVDCLRRLVNGFKLGKYPVI